MTIFSFAASLHQIYRRVSIRMGLTSCAQGLTLVMQDNMYCTVSDAKCMNNASIVFTMPQMIY